MYLWYHMKTLVQFVSIYIFSEGSRNWSRLIIIVTGTATKPRLSGNTLPNMKLLRMCPSPHLACAADFNNNNNNINITKMHIYHCENGWLNFLENLRVMALKLIDLTQFALPNNKFSFISYKPFLSVTSTRGVIFYWAQFVISTPCARITTEKRCCLSKSASMIGRLFCEFPDCSPVL